MMNDRRETFVHIVDTDVARLVSPSKVIVHLKTAVISKEHVVIIFEVNDDAVTSAKRPYAYARKMTFPAFVVLNGIEVKGVMHTTGGTDALELHRFVAVSNDKFMPVTDAIVTLPTLDFHRPTGVLINLNQMQSISGLES